MSTFTIIDELGRGGMSVVCRARDERTGRIVALKIPAGDGSVRVLLRELRMAARLVHPHIVPLLGAYEHAGRPCLAMEYIDGPTLADLLRAHGAFPLGDVLRVGIAMADALAFAHARGVLHQDVTPGNILVAPGGVPMLGDFGLGRFAAAPRGGAPRSTSQAAGTPSFLSPEQVEGRALDGRTDVFSLGAVLYELCTGRPAFDGGDLDEILDAVCYREPVPPRALRPDLPQELESILARALAKDRDERLTAAELLEALRDAGPLAY